MAALVNAASSDRIIFTSTACNLRPLCNASYVTPSALGCIGCGSESDNRAIDIALNAFRRKQSLKPRPVGSPGANFLNEPTSEAGF